MKIASFLIDDVPCFGVVIGQAIVPASAAFLAQFPDLRAVLAADALVNLRSDTTGRTDALSLGALTLLPTIPNPGKIICVGMNYRKPYPVDGVAPPDPDNIILFGKERETLVGHGAALEMPPGRAADSFDYEGEIAVIIGKAGRNIAAGAAMDHIAGYTVLNEGSVRDWQRHSIYAGKNFARSGACGPWMTTADAMPAVDEIELTTKLNGVVVQHANATEMIFSIAEQIAYVSQLLTLQPGDIIATGSPDGTGGSRNPKRYLVPGDVLDISVSGVGLLTNQVGTTGSAANMKPNSDTAW